MIKLLFIHNKLVCGGAEQALFDLVTLLDKSIFDITVLVQYDGGIWEDKFKRAGIKIVSIWDCQKTSKNPFVKLQNFFKRKKISHALLNGGSDLIDICFKESFDIIVAYQVLALHKMCFNKHSKTIKYIHGDVATNAKYCDNIISDLQNLKQFNRIICVSETAKRSFIKETMLSQNVVSHLNPVNSRRIIDLSKKGIIPHNCNISMVAVGRLSVEKGFERLIRIHKRIITQGIPHTLILVGDGPEREHLSCLISELRVEESVFMTGYTANPYPYIANSDFLVCPSYSEGMGLVALEAIILGKPVVSSASSVLEIFGNESCGIVTLPDDASLEAGIFKMLTDNIFLQNATLSAVRRSEDFKGDKMIRPIEKEFLSLITNDNNDEIQPCNKHHSPGI